MLYSTYQLFQYQQLIINQLNISKLQNIKYNLGRLPMDLLYDRLFKLFKKNNHPDI